MKVPHTARASRASTFGDQHGITGSATSPRLKPLPNALQQQKRLKLAENSIVLKGVSELQFSRSFRGLKMKVIAILGFMAMEVVATKAKVEMSAILGAKLG